MNAMRNASPVLTRYQVTSEKLRAPVRIAVISDLHNCRFGENQSALIEAVRVAAPDFVAFTGDAFHLRPSEPHTLFALTALASAYPCYFIMGNHERQTHALLTIVQEVRASGVTLLSGDCATVRANGQTLALCGLSDFSSRDPAATRAQLDAIAAKRDPRLFSALLAHRPERFRLYLPHGFDVILSGHTHGGQCRVPFARNGLYAPDQGWFPRYAGGMHTFGAQTLIISRGLSYRPYWAPRLGNPPEIVVVDLAPANRTT